VVHVRQLSIPDAYEFTPILRDDDRGVFLEWYRFDVLEQTIGHPLALRQANASVSRRGVVRGIHYADVPPGQAKYVTVARGAVLDFVVDIRVGSPTFGQWDSVLLDDVERKALYLAEGLGHALVALSDDATINYLVSDTFNPQAEHGISPLDPAIGLTFPFPVDELLFSEKDRDAPTLAEAQALGALPDYSATRGHYDSLNGTD
jgi:dTDP-4-dehydrorhamnose 3,5-epimerase